jgi:hypothetical protein
MRHPNISNQIEIQKLQLVVYNIQHTLAVAAAKNMLNYPAGIPQIPNSLFMFNNPQQSAHGSGYSTVPTPVPMPTWQTYVSQLKENITKEELGAIEAKLSEAHELLLDLFKDESRTSSTDTGQNKE